MTEVSIDDAKPSATADGSDYDVAIVGAGPAGSSAAIRLALAGKRVALIEKEKFPRDKLCGEFISPECRMHFDELGVHDAMIDAGGVELAKTIFYGRSGKGVAVPSEWFGAAHKNALGLSRAAMDHALLVRARAVGVEVYEETSAIGVIKKGDRVIGLKFRDRRGEGSHSASVTLDATGRTRFVARRADSGDAVRRAEFVAFKTHVSGCAIADDTCEIFSYKRGYGGSSRVENALHNLCFITAADDVRGLASDPARVLREIVCTNKRAADIFAKIDFVGDWHAVAIERYGSSRVAPVEGLLNIGDAAAFIDPFTGSGMLMALESASIAAKTIVQTDCRARLAVEYERRHAAAFGARLRMSAMLRLVSRAPVLAETAVRALAVSDKLRRAIVRATR